MNNEQINYPPLKAGGIIENNEPVMEMCDEGHHKFYKLPDHPKNSLGNSVCPYCLVIGRQRLEDEIEALKEALRMKVILNEHAQQAMKEYKELLK